MVASRLLRIVMCACLALPAGCTSFGYGFDDPAGEVSVVGEIKQARIRGATLFFGTARNTGDVTVENVKAVVDAFSAAGSFLGSFTGPVSSSATTETIGEEGEDIETVEIIVISDSLEIDESGTFMVESSVPFGQASRADIRFIFTTPSLEAS